MDANSRPGSILFLSCLLTACDGGSSSHGDSGVVPPDDVLTGYLSDSAVAGVAYETPTHRGVTGPDGDFQYKQGETIRFLVGDTLLGEVNGQARVSPFDLAHSEIITGTATILSTLDTERDPFHAVINIAVLLQSLDYDANPDNGIEITAEVATLFRGIDLDVSQSWTTFVSQFGLRHALGEANRQSLFSKAHGVVKPALALNHLYSTLNVDPQIYGRAILRWDDGGDGGDEVVTSDYDTEGNITLLAVGRPDDPSSRTTYQYNVMGQLTRYDVDHDGDATIAYFETHQYDDYGNLLHTEKQSGGIVTSRITQRYDWDGNRTYFDGYETGRYPWHVIASTQFDANGNPTRSEHDEDGDGNIDITSVITYDANGSEARSQRDDNGDGIPDHIYTTQYDAFGHPTRVEYDENGDNEPVTIYTAHYDENGNQTYEESDYTGDGIVDYVHRYQYDGEGNQTYLETDYNDDGIVDYTHSYQYDGDGNITRHEIDEDGDGQADRVEIYQYDSNGHQTRYEYDEDGDGTPDEIFLVQYNENGQPTRSEFRRYPSLGTDIIKTYEYDASGLPTTAESGADKDGDGIADEVYVRGQYDSNGNLSRYEEYYSGTRIYVYEYKSVGWGYIFDPIFVLPTI